jgi:hypothetical protein
MTRPALGRNRAGVAEAGRTDAQRPPARPEHPRQGAREGPENHGPARLDTCRYLAGASTGAGERGAVSSPTKRGLDASRKRKPLIDESLAAESKQGG